MFFILSFVIRFIFHFLILYGLWMFIKPIVEPAIKKTGKKIDYQMRLRFKSLVEKKISNKKKDLWIYTHIDNLLYLVKKDYEPGISILRFFVFTGLLFLSALLVGFLSVGELPNQITFDNPFLGGVQMDKTGGTIVWQFPLFLAILISILPYLRFRYIYAHKRIQSSYDLLEVVKILSKYTDHSIESSLYKTAESLSQDNVLKNPTFILASVFANYANEMELQKEVNRYASVIGTTFAIKLASNLLYLQNEGGQFLRNALMFLSSGMEEQRKAILEMKSSSRDAIALGSWGNLFVLLLCSTTMCFFLTTQVYMKLQFQTKIGLTFMIFIVAGIFISFVISNVLSKPRLDYH